MKTNKIVTNALKNAIEIILLIVCMFIVILQQKQNENKTEVAVEVETQQEEKIAEVENKVEEERTEVEVTSRHLAIRARKSEKLEKGIQEQIVEEQYTKVENITISKDMDLTVRTGISKEDFKELISRVKYDTSKFFYENSDMIYEVCEEYQINEIFFCGLISAESGWNIASNHRRTHNYISLMTKNGLIHYNSVEEGITAAAKALHNNYLTEGGRFYNGKTLYGVKTKFCPASSTWVELVYGRMQQIMKCI